MRHFCVWDGYLSVRKVSFNYYVRKMFRKTNIFTPCYTHDRKIILVIGF